MKKNKPLDNTLTKHRLNYEKRKSPRYDFDILVGFDENDQNTDGVIKNLSLGGVFIQTHKEFSVGDSLKMGFNLPDQSYPLSALGSVVRKSKTGIGIKFDDSDLETGFIGTLYCYTRYIL